MVAWCRCCAAPWSQRPAAPGQQGPSPRPGGRRCLRSARPVVDWARSNGSLAKPRDTGQYPSWLASQVPPAVLQRWRCRRVSQSAFPGYLDCHNGSGRAQDVVFKTFESSRRILVQLLTTATGGCREVRTRFSADPHACIQVLRASCAFPLVVPKQKQFVSECKIQQRLLTSLVHSVEIAQAGVMQQAERRRSFCAGDAEGIWHAWQMAVHQLKCCWFVPRGFDP